MLRRIAAVDLNLPNDKFDVIPVTNSTLLRQG
jgi:hypothetical protein